jgi:hypothetical protein
MYSIIMTFEPKALHTSAKTARRPTKLIQVCFYLLFPPYVSVIPDLYLDCHTYYCILYFHYGCVHGKPYRRLPCHLHVMTFRDNTTHVYTKPDCDLVCLIRICFFHMYRDMLRTKRINICFFNIDDTSLYIHVRSVIYMCGFCPFKTDMYFTHLTYT